MITAIALTIAAPAQTAHAEWNHPLPRAWYERLATCETGANTAHSTRNYTGAFGIYRRTWQLFADAPSAKGLDFAAQARVVDRIAWFGHTEHGRKQWPVGPWGWGCIKKSPALQADICRSNNKHVARWKRNCTTHRGKP